MCYKNLRSDSHNDRSGHMFSKLVGGTQWGNWAPNWKVYSSEQPVYLICSSSVGSMHVERKFEGL